MSLNTTLQQASTGQQIEIIQHPDGVRIAILDHADVPEAIFDASGESALLLASWLVNRAMPSRLNPEQVGLYLAIKQYLKQLSASLFEVNRP